jgi:hypothetical protein
MKNLKIRKQFPYLLPVCVIFPINLILIIIFMLIGNDKRKFLSCILDPNTLFVNLIGRMDVLFTFIQEATGYKRRSEIYKYVKNTTSTHICRCK